MSVGEVEVLERAHRLFSGDAARPALRAGAEQHLALPRRATSSGGAEDQPGYRSAADHIRQQLLAAARTDDDATRVLAEAHRDRERARDLTKRVVDEARADAAVAPTTPMAGREELRRRVARLRAQRSHVSSARLNAGRHSAALRALRYRPAHRRPLAPRSPNARAALAVRAALSRLGRPYVWGATGPDRFDCSGLVQWAYAHAGIHLGRTTYQQINDGIPVPRSQVRPGDLVFPHAGHVQLALGNDLVVEAPYSGASVRISRLGGSVAIRRPS